MKLQVMKVRRLKELAKNVRFCTNHLQLQELCNNNTSHNLNCQECGKQAQTKQNFRNHATNHTSHNLNCQKCGKQALKNQNFMKHKLSNHSQSIQVVCAECGKQALTNQNFRNYATHHTSHILNCQECGKHAISNYNFRKHKMSNHSHSIHAALEKLSPSHTFHMKSGNTRSTQHKLIMYILLTCVHQNMHIQMRFLLCCVIAQSAFVSDLLSALSHWSQSSIFASSSFPALSLQCRAHLCLKQRML